MRSAPAIVPRARQRSLWRCSECGRSFANRNQSHACGRYTLAGHFAGKPPHVRRLFDAVREAVRRIDRISARNHVHQFRLTRLADVDAQFRRWLAEAYEVGQQHHLREPT
jgi:hypothetical protein